MLNPNQLHRSRGVIEKINNVDCIIRLKNGHTVKGWTDDMPKNATIGTPVNIQASFSITLDQYICRTIRLIKIKK